MKRLILASASPRRRKMLRELGIACTAVASSFQEPPHVSGQSPSRYVQHSAAAKAKNVAQRFKNALVIGADTVVVHRGRVLGKPRTRQEAFAYMRMLNGATHAVYSGLAIINTENQTVLTGYEKTLVTFRKLTDYEIQAYLKLIHPLDKAGAYAIQGAGALIVKGIQGCYYNVVGFPIAKLEQMMLQQGVSLFQYIKKSTEC